jgi:hypothetical protein
MPEFVCYRASSYRTPVRARRHGTDSEGRYHEPGSEPTQYFSLHPLTPWAELARNQGCADLEDWLEIRGEIWALRLVPADEPEEVNFDRAAAGDLLTPISPDELTADDPTACRALAEAHRSTPGAARVIRVPSAALPGTDNIVVFGARRMIRYEAIPLREAQVPAAIAAVNGRGAEDLFRLVRRKGDPHAAYEAWASGSDYELPLISTVPL